MNRIQIVHWILPGVVLLASIIIFDLSGFDYLIAETIHDLGGQKWILKNSWLLEDALHRGGRGFIAMLFIATIFSFLLSWVNRAFVQYRTPLGVLLVAVTASLLLISVLKEITNVPCPWHIDGLGGTQKYFPTFQQIVKSSGGRCFPSGHASGGFAWIALYFFCCVACPKYRFQALTFSMVLGLIFGVAQQLRGAHFLSHDIWSLVLSWYVGLIIFNWRYAHRHTMRFTLANAETRFSSALTPQLSTESSIQTSVISSQDQPNISTRNSSRN